MARPTFAAGCEAFISVKALQALEDTTTRDNNFDFQEEWRRSTRNWFWIAWKRWNWNETWKSARNTRTSSTNACKCLTKTDLHIIGNATCNKNQHITQLINCVSDWKEQLKTGGTKAKQKSTSREHMHADLLLWHLRTLSSPIRSHTTQLRQNQSHWGEGGEQALVWEKKQGIAVYFKTNLLKKTRG